ncbi:MAG: hypothetical protein EPN93_20440 [Spirochaetes bacterium]|nr:MAG: hypothetical protein EPN93_20440 [Spirochaetota bacterium]
MKKLILMGLIIPAMCYALAGISCFDAPRDNMFDPKADNFSGSDLFLFSTAPVNNGAQGGRAGLDTLCASTRNTSYTELPSDNVHAFISVGLDDEIRDMPVKYSLPTYLPIKSHTGLVIADNWADLFDGSIDQTLEDAEIASTGWWSGSLVDGSSSGATCNGWIANATLNGQVGYIGVKDNDDWINAAINTCDVATNVVLCISWND